MQRPGWTAEQNGWPDSARDVILVVTWLAMCLIVVRVAVGFHYETNDDPIMEAIFRGTLFPGSESREIGFAHQFTATVYTWLYAVAPRLPWYGAAMYALTAAAMVQLLLAVDASMARRRGTGLRLAILTLFFGLFLAESAMLLNFTRVAILLGGSAIVTLRRVASRAPTPWPLLGATAATFALALMTRPEGAALSLMTVGVFALLVARRHEVVALAASLAALSAMTAASQAYAASNGREPRFRAAYPFLVSIRDLRRVRPGALSADDSLRLRAVNGWLFSEPEATSVDFLGRVASADHFTSDRLRPGTVETALRPALADLGPGGWLIGLANACVLLLSLRGVQRARSETLRSLAAHGLFWLALGALAIFIRLPARVLSPEIAIYASASLCALPSVGGAAAALRLLAGAGAGVALLATGLTQGRVRHVALTGRNEQRANEWVFMELQHRLPERTTLVLAFPASRVFERLDPLHAVPLDRGRHNVLLGGWPCLLTAFEAEAERIGGARGLPALLAGLQRSGSLVLSSDAYNDFLAKHLSALHGRTLSFTPESAWLTLRDSPKDRLRLYGFAISSERGSLEPPPRSGDPH